MEEYPKPEEFLQETRRLTEAAQKEGLFLRVMGPIALYFYFPDYIDLYQHMDRLGERVFGDIDYASYGKTRGKLVSFFLSQGYDFDKDTMMYFGKERHIYFSDRIPMIDVFYDKLDMNHCVDFRGRLEIHPYCISLTDLLLQKLEIVKINDKDLKDAMLLLVAAPLGNDDLKTINKEYLAKRMSDDWGFYYTSIANLEHVKKACAKVPALKEDHQAIICQKVDEIIKVIEDAPKTFGWKLRARTGTKKLWYTEVSDWA
jgi:hypothetical protein